MSKVLLVEDDNNLREIYEARLQAEGYTIVTAHDGEEALVVAKAEHPDLIISDVMMPKVSGFEMLDIVRNTEGLQDVKVIMLTALGQADDQQRADRLGADSYLVKSQVTLEDIVKVASRLLGETTDEPTAPVAAESAPEVAAPAVVEPPMPPVAVPQSPVVVVAAVPSVVPVPEAEPVAVAQPSPLVPEPIVVVAAPVEPLVVATEPAVPAEQTATVEPETPAEPATTTVAPPTEQPPTTEEAFFESLGASNTSFPVAADIPIPPSQTAQEEEATVAAQIAEFANSESAVPAQVEPTDTPTESEDQFVTTEAPDLVSTTIIPEPSAQQAGNDDVLATALHSLGGDTNPAPAETTVPEEITVSTATPPAPAPTATPAKGGERVIVPIGSPSDKPDLNSLLMKEEEQDRIMAMQTPGASIITPTAPLSESPAPVTNNGQPPTQGFDPNSISL